MPLVNPAKSQSGFIPTIDKKTGEYQELEVKNSVSKIERFLIGFMNLLTLENFRVCDRVDIVALDGGYALAAVLGGNVSYAHDGNDLLLYPSSSNAADAVRLVIRPGVPICFPLEFGFD